MTRKRNKTTQPAVESWQKEDIFAALNRHGTHNLPIEQPEQQRAGQSQAQPVSVADLQKQISDMRTQLDTANRRAMLAAPAPIVQQQRMERIDPATIKLDLKGLPDPGIDFAGYQTALQERINAVIEARTYAATEAINSRIADQNESSTQATRLWDGFSSKYPDWAAHEDLVGLVAKQVAERAVAQGIDTKRYILSDPELFYADVAAELGKKYGALLSSEEEDEELDNVPEHLKVGQKQVGIDPRITDNETDGRTAGIMGGQESGGKPSPGRNAPVNDMIADLQAMQMKTGFY